MKTILVTQGDSWDHVHAAILEVPDGTDDQGLWDVFMKEYFPEKKDLRGGGVTPEWEAQQEYIRQRVKAMQGLGYKGFDEVDLFIDWLCKKHGCRSIVFEEWHY